METNYTAEQSIDFTTSILFPYDFKAIELRIRQNSTNVSAENLKQLYDQDRNILFWVYLVIYIVAVIGNVAAVICTAKRKHRCVQKTFIISLALSDLITATSIVTLCLRTFVQSVTIWTMGSFLCSFLPSVQVFGIVCSSAALVGIALDRYRNVVHALKRRWNPQQWQCMCIIVLVWCVSIGVGAPMFIFFEAVPIRVVFYDYETDKTYFKDYHMCVTFAKTNLMIYFLLLMSLVFIPLFSIFFWLYFKIAQLVWKHRRPLSQIFHKKIDTSTTVETSIRSIEESSRTTTTTTSDPQVESLMKSKNARMQRKVRTFKIIIFLMFIFVILRFPSWLFDTLKLCNQFQNHAAWLTKYICTALTLFHCALNPFLYTFLNETLNFFTRIIKTLREFMCEVCCCCFSNAEFEEFENENPFVREQFERQCPNVASQNKSNNKNSKVKFDNLPAIKLYSTEKTPEGAETCEIAKKY